jgi:exonuclease VII small subunit
MTKKNDLSSNLKKLSQIVEWFESKDEVDVEEGLEKIKEASLMIKESKKRLKEIENQFQEIKKEVDNELENI